MANKTKSPAKEQEQVDEEGRIYIDLTPTPAQHMLIMARMADNLDNRYVSDELRRIARIYEKRELTWDEFNEFLNKKKK